MEEEEEEEEEDGIVKDHHHHLEGDFEALWKKRGGEKSTNALPFVRYIFASIRVLANPSPKRIMRRKWEGEEEWGENEKEQQHSQTRMEKSGRRKWRLRASYEDHGMGDEGGAPKEACRKQANYMGEGREKSATEKRGASFSFPP